MTSFEVVHLIDAPAGAAEALAAARRAGFARTEQLELATAVTELLTNAVKFGGRARLTIEVGESEESIEVIVADEGPGIDDVELAFTDRYSEGALRTDPLARRRGLGLGLGAVRRLVDEISIEKNQPTGTIVHVVKRRKNRPKAR